MAAVYRAAGVRLARSDALGEAAFAAAWEAGRALTLEQAVSEVLAIASELATVSAGDGRPEHQEVSVGREAEPAIPTAVVGRHRDEIGVLQLARAFEQEIGCWR